MKQHNIIIVCGPTATGKSDYAVTLAKKVGGEIISADSRQVYRGLNIGSGKITEKEMKGVRHHLLDVADPGRVFSVTQFQKKGRVAIANIIKRGHVPIICGGTGFYIDALVYDQVFPAVKPNTKLRKTLEKLDLETLREQLRHLDTDRYESIDIHNKVRLIRAIEIAQTLGHVPKITKHSSYDIEWHYLDFSDELLKDRIHKRLLKRMRQGMIKEAQDLHEQGLSLKRMESLGLEYRYLAMYLQSMFSKSEMITQLEAAIWQYVKRQRTWFKKYAK